MKTLSLLSLLFLLLSGCYSKVNDQVDPGEQNRTINSKEACERGECPCDTPVGTINHGSKISTYSQSAVQCDQGCAAFARESTCNNGVLTPDPKNGFSFYRCQVAECPACTLEGNLILSGETVDTYSKEVVGCRESCEDFKQERTCNLGTLSGSSNYHYFNCKRKECRCDLPDSSGFVSLDGTIKLYNTQQASCGSTCAASSQIRTCKMTTTNGNDTFYLDQSAAYRYRTCQEATNCVCTLPNNLGIMMHGQVKTISKVASVTCGNLCSAQANITVKCDNGIFRDNSNLNVVVDFSTTTYQDYKYVCQAQDCVACQVPGTTTSVMHGDYYRFFKSSTVGCSETCEDQNRQCFNGSFLPAGSIYNSPTCQRRSCTCNVPGVSGVTVPVGSNWLFYSSANAQCGQTCAQLSTPKTCTEVFSNGNYTYEFQGASEYTNAQCSPATGCSCALPAGLGQIDHNKTVVLTSLNPVPCGTTCDQAPSISLKCDNGILKRTTDGSAANVSDPAFPYKYYCKTATCSDCSLPGYGTIANNSQITLFSKSVLVCGDKPEDFTFDFQCQNGALLKNGNPYTPSVQNGLLRPQ
jgi:hypothetical protein